MAEDVIAMFFQGHAQGVVAFGAAAKQPLVGNLPGRDLPVAQAVNPNHGEDPGHKHQGGEPEISSHGEMDGEVSKPTKHLIPPAKISQNNGHQRGHQNDDSGCQAAHGKVRDHDDEEDDSEIYDEDDDSDDEVDDDEDEDESLLKFKCSLVNNSFVCN